MMEKHVSDHDIQTFLDGSAGNLEEQIRSHMRRCDACQEKYRQYRELTGMLAVPPEMELRPGFAEKVLHHPDFPIDFHPEFILPYLFSLIGVIAACAGIFIYLGINPKDYFSVLFNLSLLESVRDLLDTLSPAVKPFLHVFSGRMDMILFSLLALVVVFLLDRFVLRGLLPNSGKPSGPSFPVLI